MKFIRNFTLYAGLIIIFGGLIFCLLHTGKKLDHAILQIPKTSVNDPAGGGIFSGLFQTNLSEALPRLLLQIIIIIATTQLLGSVFRKIGQPAVIGETVAGIFLVLHYLAVVSAVFHFIFPAESLPNLRFLSQIGLILFMFIIGMELDTRLLRKQAFEALIISHASILIPFTSRYRTFVYYLYHTYAGTQTNFYSFALFMGIAMSITAFPVLARIIRDRKLTETKLGILAISCAASDDVTAWCILAILIALIRIRIRHQWLSG